MAAAPAMQSNPHLDERSFFFALSEDMREFVYPGNSKEWLSLRMLSLGFGARDDVHVLEAEGAHGGGENARLVAQTTAMLGLQPSLPAVTLTTTVLTPPVTFRLRSGPGPLYVSGSHLLILEEAPALNIPKTCEEPAQKRAKVSPEADMDPLFANTLQNLKGSLVPYPTVISEVKNASQGRRRVSSKSKKASKEKKEHSKTCPEDRDHKILKDLDRIKGKVKAKILESMAKGVKLSNVKFRFERFLEHCHKVTDPYLVHELWKWRKSLGF